MITNTHTRNLTVKACFTAIFLYACLPLLAQQQTDAPLRVVPLGHAASTESARQPQARQKAAGDTLLLPFWDDFSAPYNTTQAVPTYQPDTNLWAEGSQHLRINEGTGNNPPTVGVVTFDGLDVLGRPYSNNETQASLSDSLTSKPINLAAVPLAERNSVFLSFFWQPMGKRELPDPEDSLRLQFKNRQGNWITQWVKAGNDSLPVDVFTQEMIQVSDTSFFHTGFQFRFQSYNRQYASFDNWHVDYIYLNKNRSASNKAHTDRALTSTPTSLFKTYTAIPMKAFRTDPASFIDSASVGYNRLNTQQFQPIEYKTLVRNKANGQVITVLDEERELALNNVFRTTLYASPLPVSTLNLDEDSLYLSTEFFLNSGDKAPIVSINGADTVFSTKSSYRANDTVAATFVLDDYFAYDDGEAESGLELNQNGAQLAYQYVTPTEMLLTHIDIYFPAILQNVKASSVKLMVWKKLGADSASTVILSQASGNPIQIASYINEIKSYALTTPVNVQDTFYIGYQVESDSVPVVGFDKNTNSANKLFYKLSGSWQQNNELSGSLMLRPKFGTPPPVTAIGGDKNASSEAKFNVYPNPAQDEVHVKGLHEEIILLDLTGREIIRYHQRLPQQQTTYQLGHLKKGLYLLRIRHKNQYHTFKLVLQ